MTASRETSVFERFSGSPSARWRTVETGGGRLGPGPNGLRLENKAASADAYANAQIDDYQQRPRREFLWRPPLRLTVRARFSHADSLRGTAGFGFWNDPFLMTGLRAPGLPQALWFFYASPPSDMRLARGVPGWGWKAAVIDARRPQFLALAPLLAAAVPLLAIRPVYRKLWPIFQRSLGVAERLISPADGQMTGWHVYTIDWQPRSVQFFIDGRLLLETAHAPPGPLGLVLWLDNQYLQVAPWGRLGWGLLAKREPQWLEIEWLALERRPVW